MTRDLFDTSVICDPRDALDFLTNILESSTEYSIIGKDLDGTIDLWNEGARRIYGYEPDEVVGRANAAILYTPQDVAQGKPREILDAALRDGKWEGTLDRVRKSGERFKARVVITLRRGADGQASGYLLISKDISVEVRRTEELEAAQFYTRGLIEASVDALVMVDPEYRITDVNAQMVRMTGYTREDLIGSPFPNYFIDPGAATSGVRRTFEEGSVTNHVLVLQPKNEYQTTVSFNASVFRDPNGNVRGIFASARDITEQTRLEEELRQAQNYTRGLIESSVDPMITVDPTLTITDVNEQMVRLTEVQKDALIGSRFDRYFTEPGAAATGVRQTLRDGYVRNYELTLRTLSGREVPVSFNASIFRDTEGKVRGIFAVARDVTDQNRLERELREQQTYNRGLVESNIDALMTTDPVGVITDVNRQMCEITGRERDELIGTPFKDYFTDPRRAEDGIRRVLAEGRVTNYELTIRAKDGKETVVSYNATTFVGADGRLRGVFAAARDITDQKRLEEQLRDQQTYNRSLIDSNIDVLTTTDTLGIIIDVNRYMCEITGREHDELIGTPFKDYFTDPRRAEDGVSLVLAEGRATNYELTIRGKDGKETVVSYNATIFRGDDGRIQGVFASARDITDQKRLEEQIRHQNRRLIEATAFMNNVLESSTEYSIIAMDLDGQFLTWNEGARRNYGYTSEEMVGKQNSDILHTPEDISSGTVRTLYDTTLRTGKAEGVVERVRKSGQRFAASDAITLRKDADGSPIGYVLISKDITEQKLHVEQIQRKNDELEEQYRQVQEANRRKSEFLADMSHELRTPLNGIIGFAELMHDFKVGPVSDEQHEYLGDILTSSKHLLQLINDVLDLSKVEAGKMEIRPEPVDLGKVVAETRDILRTLAARKRIRVKVEVDPTLTDVMADPAKLKQILYNYLSNALKFTPDEGYVAIRVRPEGDARVRLEVVDSGIGIRPEDVRRLFVEFQQLDAGAAKKYQGTGLGLALTKRIVEAQGGFVGVTSAVGQGSTFYAVLPRIIQPSASKSDDYLPPPRASVAGAPAILVVEDEPGDRDWLTRTLSGAGYEVALATTGAEAIQKAQARAFDAITLDLLLPDLGGGDVLRALRSNGPNQATPVIIVTVMREQGIGVGFPIYDILAKPVEESILLSALARVVDHDGRGRTVLVVDDDLTLLKLLEVRLRAAGYRPVCVPDAEEGLRAAREENPAVIVLDLLLPGVDGFTFLQRFRSTDAARRVPIIISTSKELSEDERAQLLASAQAVVLKGFAATADLLDEIRSLVRPAVDLAAASP